jgi:hypothetical protein
VGVAWLPPMANAGDYDVGRSLSMRAILSLPWHGVNTSA